MSIYEYPMENPYTEEIISYPEGEPPRHPVCFSEWIGVDHLIYGSQTELFLKRLNSPSITKMTPMPGLDHPEDVNCMMSNPSKTKLAVGFQTKFIIYKVPSFAIIYEEHYNNETIMSEVCWLDNNDFATINSSGTIGLGHWKIEGGVFGEYEFLGPGPNIPRFGIALPNGIKHHVFDYHSEYKKFLYLSLNEPSLKVISSDLTSYKSIPIRTSVFGDPLKAPIMIAVHSSCQDFLVASLKNIYAFNGDTLELTYSIPINDYLYSLSVAGEVITYSVGRDPKEVRFMHGRGEHSNHSLLSQNTITVNPGVEKTKDCFVTTSYPFIYTHCYSLNRNQIFCGGAIRDGPSDIGGYPHAAIWTLSAGPPIKRQKK